MGTFSIIIIFEMKQLIHDYFLTYFKSSYKFVSFHKCIYQAVGSSKLILLFFVGPAHYLRLTLSRQSKTIRKRHAHIFSAHVNYGRPG